MTFSFNNLKKIIPKHQRVLIKEEFWKITKGSTSKIFGIGDNKTGTTSLKSAMKNLGYRIGDQRKAEHLHLEWANRDFKPIIDYSKTAEFFQDFPFSKPYTYIALDQAFSGSKFILTIRDNPEQWYNSLTRFHAKKWGKNGRIPTKEDLQNATYLWKGRPWQMNRLQKNTPEDDPYNKELLIEAHQRHNQNVKDYFKHRPDDLLVLNVSEKGAYRNLCEFLGNPVTREHFPWENKT